MIGHAFPEYKVYLKNTDTMLYALSIGFQEDALNKSHFKFTYENDENFQAFPTNAVVINHRFADKVFSIPGFPDFNPMMLLHGEEHLEILGKIEGEKEYTVQEKIIDCQDKGKITILMIEAQIRDSEKGQVVAKVVTSIVIRGVGGYGHKGTIKIKYPTAPKDRKPDLSFETKT